MVDEPNRIPYVNEQVPREFHSGPEVRTQSEVNTYQEVHTYSELGPLEPTREQRASEERKRNKARSHLLAATVIVAAVVVLGVVPNPVHDSIYGPAFDPLGPGGDAAGEDGGLIELIGSFVSFDVTDTTIRYAASIEGSQEGDSYTVTLENKFTSRTQTFSGDSFTSIERDLEPGMTYTLTLLGGSTVLDTATVTTEREHEAHFHLAEAYCTCPVDGMFHITVDIVDDEGVWDHLRVELADRYGAVSVATVDGQTAEQSIPVTSAGLRGDSADLRIYAVLSEGAEELLYSGEHMI